MIIKEKKKEIEGGERVEKQRSGGLRNVVGWKHNWWQQRNQLPPPPSPHPVPWLSLRKWGPSGRNVSILLRWLWPNWLGPVELRWRRAGGGGEGRRGEGGRGEGGAWEGIWGDPFIWFDSFSFGFPLIPPSIWFLIRFIIIIYPVF